MMNLFIFIELVGEKEIEYLVNRAHYTDEGLTHD
jgi:hypothetical protein